LGSLEKLGTGTLTLTGTNAYAGGTTVSGGVLEATTPDALPDGGASGDIGTTSSGVLAVSTAGWDSGDIAALVGNSCFSGNLGIDVPASSAFTYSSDIQNTSLGLTKLGAGTLTLGGDNQYTAGTTVAAGTLQLGDGTTNRSVPGNITDNASLVFANASAQSYSGVISGTGGVTKVGAGTLTLSGVNLYTGGTTVAAGTLALSGGDDRLSTSGAITMAGGTLDLGGHGQTTSGGLSFQTNPGSVVQNGSLTLVGTGTVLAASQSGRIDTDLALAGSGDWLWSIGEGATLTFGGDVSFAVNDNEL
jgi:fibronectin-binding autotransporter adhesin